MPRPAVPAELKRRLYEESGYRCAIPTCRGTSALNMEHIDDWASVKEHKFENMIVLCATCHSRVTSKEIHKDAIRTYKRNLAIISGRYSLYEIRLFQAVYSKIDEQPLSFRIAENDFLHVKGAVDDKLFQVVKLGLSVSIGGVSVSPLELVLTDLGRTFIRQFFEGKLIE